MRCYRKISEIPRILMAALLLCLCLAAPSVALGEVEIRSTRFVAGDEGYSLSADFDISFSPRLEEAVARGVVLYFVADFELTRQRWYWFDEKIVKASQIWRLSYHALTRQYRLYSGSSGALHQSFGTLADALHVLSHIRSWQVAGKDRLAPDTSYEAALRLRLDPSQLPKPFQIEAMANRDWNLASEWERWRFTPGVPPPVSAPSPEGDTAESR